MSHRAGTDNSTVVHRSTWSATRRSFVSLVVVNLKLFMREPAAAFFTVAFPVMLVVVFGMIYGNEADEMFDGYGAMDISMPAYTALIVGTVGLLGVAINTSGYREAGVLRRFRATPMRPLVYIAADLTSNLIMMLTGMAAVLIVGWSLYRVRFEGQAGSVAFAVALSGAAMIAVGYLIAGIAPTARTAQVVGMFVLYPMIFLSGATIPLEVMPDSVEAISDFLPLTYVVRLLRGLWFGESWGSLAFETCVLAGILLIGTTIASRLFRWE